MVVARKETKARRRGEAPPSLLSLFLSLLSNVRGETGGDERDKKAGSLYVALDIVRSMEHFRLVWICHLLVSGGIRH